MKNVPDTKLGRMYREHIQLILDKNIDALLDQYTDDCLLISSFMKKPIIYKGREPFACFFPGSTQAHLKPVKINRVNSLFSPPLQPGNQCFRWFIANTSKGFYIFIDLFHLSAQLAQAFWQLRIKIGMDLVL